MFFIIKNVKTGEVLSGIAHDGRPFFQKMEDEHFEALLFSNRQDVENCLSFMHKKSVTAEVHANLSIITLTPSN